MTLGIPVQPSPVPDHILSTIVSSNLLILVGRLSTPSAHLSTSSMRKMDPWQLHVEKFDTRHEDELGKGRGVPPDRGSGVTLAGTRQSRSSAGNGNEISLWEAPAWKVGRGVATWTVRLWLGAQGPFLSRSRGKRTLPSALNQSTSNEHSSVVCIKIIRQLKLRCLTSNLCQKYYESERQEAWEIDFHVVFPFFTSATMLTIHVISVNQLIIQK